MSGECASGPDWAVVDEGWGRKAVDFATLSEPANCREYVALHHMLGIDTGDRLLDVACGAGLAIELACVRGADCAGIDASAWLVAVARDRSPRADIRVGDMHALPWDDGGFTVVTSFRGIWGTTPAAMKEVCRVLRPGTGADSYCSLAWGTKLAARADAQLAAGVLRGDDGALTEAERAMAAWARRVANDPNGTSAEDVQELRDAGFSDADIFAMTVYVALRVALSTVNDALGARPDAEYRTLAPAPVRDAVTFGRPIDASLQPPR